MVQEAVLIEVGEDWVETREWSPLDQYAPSPDQNYKYTPIQIYSVLVTVLTVVPVLFVCALVVL